MVVRRDATDHPKARQERVPSASNHDRAAAHGFEYVFEPSGVEIAEPDTFR